jgi:hypothetical protein
MCPVWDGGSAQQPEDEREQQHDFDGGDDWQPAHDGDMPWDPNPADKPEAWKSYDWHDGPEYRAWKKKQQEEDDGS